MIQEKETPHENLNDRPRLPSPWVAVVLGIASVSMVQSWFGPLLGLLAIYLAINQIRIEKGGRLTTYVGFILGISGLVIGVGNLPQMGGGQQYTESFQDYIGASAGDFTLPDISGKKHSLSEYAGKVVLVNFWATWCPACRVEIPDLVLFRNLSKDRGFEILGISGEGPVTQKKFAESYQVEYPLLVDNPAVSLPAPFSLVLGMGIPTSFLIDRNGIIREAFTWPITGAELEKMTMPWLKNTSANDPGVAGSV